MERERRNTFEFLQVADVKRGIQDGLLLEFVVGKSGTNYLITNVSKDGLEATVIDYTLGNRPEKVLLPNDAYVTFANLDSLRSKYPLRLDQLIREAKKEKAKLALSEAI